MIPITVPCVGPEEEAAAAAVIRSGWLTQGPKVEQFEQSVAAVTGTQHAVAVTSCTTALHLSLAVLDLKPGDEVICPSMSFIATANAIRHAGATPVFVEVDPRTYNMDPQATAKAVTARTRAILPVHQVGLPARLDAFVELANQHHLALIEDAACAIGSRYKGHPIGGDGLMACFSFHPRKILTTGEGGVITTNDSAIASRLKLLRQHGMSVSDRQRHSSNQVIVEQYLETGFNYRMCDVQAAIGIEQVKRLPAILQRRREIAKRYTQSLDGHPWLCHPHVPEDTEPNFQSYIVHLSDDSPFARNELMQLLLDRKIATRRGIMLAHLEPAYRDMGVRLPVSERASEQSLLLPIYPAMTDEQVDWVLKVLWDLAKTSGSHTEAA